MKNQYERIAAVVEAALRVLDVIQDIFRTYQTAVKDTVLYDIQEFTKGWEILKTFSQKKESSRVDELVYKAFLEYINPLPIRPLVSKLVSARMKLISSVHKNLKVETRHAIQMTDKFFNDSLSRALMYHLPSFASPHDELFIRIRRYFVVHFRHRIENEYSLIDKKVTATPIQPKELPLKTNLFSPLNQTDTIDELDEHISPIIQAAHRIIDIIHDISKAYRNADQDTALYDIHEFSKTWELMKNLSEKKDSHGLGELINKAFFQYINPLPIRPLVSKLVSARMKLISSFQKNLELEKGRTIQIADRFFNDSLSCALMYHLPLYASAHAQFFNAIKKYISIYLHNRIENEYSLIDETAAPTPIQPYEPSFTPNPITTPSLFNKDIQVYDGYNSDGEEIIEIIVP